MSNDRLDAVLGHYEKRGVVERVDGDFSATARGWLGAAEAELAGVVALLEARQWRLAYNAAYDICRHAAEAVNTSGGYRVTAAAGAHEATFALADALLSGSSDVFSAVSAGTARQKRNSLEYIDLGRPAEVDEVEARWASSLAQRAVAAAADLLS